jgi:hypothetical protein
VCYGVNQTACFADWLEPVPGDSRNARCAVCEVVVPAHHAGLCRHAQEPKHGRRFAEKKSTLKGACVTSDKGSACSQKVMDNNLVSPFF